MDSIRKQRLEQDIELFKHSFSRRYVGRQLDIAKMVDWMLEGCLLYDNAHSVGGLRNLYREVIPIVNRVPHGLNAVLKSDSYSFTLNQEFIRVMDECSKPRTDDGQDVWIGHRLKANLEALNQAGYAHSVEIYEKEDLVGGALGVQFGGMYISLSVFSWADGAGNTAVAVLQKLLHEQQFALHDAMTPSSISRHFGGRMILHDRYMKALQVAIQRPAYFPSISQKTSAASYCGFK